MRPKGSVMTVLWGMRARFPLSAGFTLLELMISLTIVSMIVVAVYAAFNIGTESTRRGTARALDNQHARAALSLLTRQLKSAYPLTLQDEGETFVYFFGAAEELSFISGDGRAEAGGLSKITYFLREEDGRVGLWVRTTAPVLPVDLIDGVEGGVVQETQLLPEVDELNWTYLGRAETDDEWADDEWTDEWDGQEYRRLPRAIRCAWRAQLGQLPLEWEFEVPIQVRSAPSELWASPQSGDGEGRRRRGRR